MESILAQKSADIKARWSFSIIASFSLIILVCIFIFLFSIGIQSFREISIREFLFTTTWNPDGYSGALWGIGGLLFGTLCISFVALVTSVPLGFSIAIYLSEIASSKTREILKPVIEMISSVPSVVLGLLGILYIAPIFAKVFHTSNGFHALTAGVLVGIAALPTIASISEDALRAVSHRYREASLALGADHWTTIWKVVMPAARSGLLASIMLGFGRIVGETMIVLMVAGNSLAFPHSLFDSVRPLTANIAIEIKEVVTGGTHWKSLFALGGVLFLITFFVNVIADIYVKRRATPIR